MLPPWWSPKLVWSCHSSARSGNSFGCARSTSCFTLCIGSSFDANIPGRYDRPLQRRHREPYRHQARCMFATWRDQTVVRKHAAAQGAVIPPATPPSRPAVATPVPAVSRGVERSPPSAPPAQPVLIPNPPSQTGVTAAGGNTKVWTNASTKVYHCPSDRWCGQTKKGEYLTQSEAVARGFHPSHGKACP